MLGDGSFEIILGRGHFSALFQSFDARKLILLRASLRA